MIAQYRKTKSVSRPHGPKTGWRLAIAITAICAGALSLPASLRADAGIEDLKKSMQGQLELMKPELRSKVEGLSMDTKMSLMAIMAMHSRHSKLATLRQVMTEVQSDYHSMLTGIMTENPEHAADSARRLANHRIPVGGLLPYLGMDNISDEKLSVLEGFNNTVEGNALKLAEAAEAGDMVTAASLVGPITSGCVACHGVFRSKPGVSNLLR